MSSHKILLKNSVHTRPGQEISEKNSKKIRKIIKPVEEGVEKMVFDRYRYRGGVEEQINRYKNRSSIDPPGVKKLSRRQELSRSIHQVSRRYRDCDNKKLKKLDRQQGIEEVSRRCRASF